MPRYVILAVAGMILADAQAPAAEQTEPLPLPRVLPQPNGEPPMAYPAVVVRRNPYEVWQYYGVDRYGFFRPLVVYSPYGPYYRYGGAAFPWAATHQLDFMPYIVDAPEGLGPQR